MKLLEKEIECSTLVYICFMKLITEFSSVQLRQRGRDVSKLSSEVRLINNATTSGEV